MITNQTLSRSTEIHNLSPIILDKKEIHTEKTVVRIIHAEATDIVE